MAVLLLDLLDREALALQLNFIVELVQLIALLHYYVTTRQLFTQIQSAELSLVFARYLPHAVHNESY